MSQNRRHVDVPNDHSWAAGEKYQMANDKVHRAAASELRIQWDVRANCFADAAKDLREIQDRTINEMGNTEKWHCATDVVES